jgi:hypothetical protein
MAMNSKTGDLFPLSLASGVTEIPGFLWDKDRSL